VLAAAVDVSSSVSSPPKSPLSPLEEEDEELPLF